MCQGGDDGDPTTSPRRVDPVANKSVRRHLKRALKGTVGVSLAVTAAVLLARSEEIGEWLRLVAPNVMPDAAAGADVVHRAIENAKTCLQRDGLNVCLDAEGRVTALYAYMSQWYLSPKQHVIETGISILVLAPLSYLWFKACQARARSHDVRGTFDVKKSSLLIRLWGITLLACVGVGVAFKFSVNELISHPAYIWQPCHVHSFVMGVCAFFAREWSLLVMHVSTTLWWGPFLACIAPSLPSHPIEVVVFWIQHTLMLLAPFLRLVMGGDWMYSRQSSANTVKADKRMERSMDQSQQHQQHNSSSNITKGGHRNQGLVRVKQRWSVGDLRTVSSPLL